MKKFLYFSAASVAFFGLAVQSASAEVFVWRDQASKMTVSYPDTWRHANNQNPNDRLTVLASGPNDFAQCVVNIQEEGRFKVYPVGLSAPIQRLYVSAEYWDEYLARYDNPVLHDGYDNRGLGDGNASMVSVSYTTAKGAKMQRRALGFASYFDNRLYTVECSAEESAYHKWHKPFLSFIKSVDFNAGTNYKYNGYYRNFITDDTLKVRGPRVTEDTYLGVHDPDEPWWRIF